MLACSPVTARQQSDSPSPGRMELLKGNAQRLAELVKAEIVANPVLRDGFAWSSRSQEWYATELGLSTRTVGKLSQQAGFDRLDVLIEGKRTLLLRLRKPGDPMTLTHCQRALKHIFLTHIRHFNQKKAFRHAKNVRDCEAQCKILSTKIEAAREIQNPDADYIGSLEAQLMEVQNQAAKEAQKAKKAEADADRKWTCSRQSYGCLRGIAESWGTLYACEIMTIVLKDWTGFMAASKGCISEFEESHGLFVRYYEYPTIRYLHYFNHVGLDVALTHCQSRLSGLSKEDSTYADELKRHNILFANYNAALGRFKARLSEKAAKTH